MRPLVLASSIGVMTATLLVVGGPAQAKGQGKMTVEMHGFRNNKGMMRISLYRTARGYPGDHRHAFRKGSARIVGKKAKFVFDNLPHATYAISVLHDENNNKKMDTNWIGIPKEGGGASRNAKARFGPPKFKDAKFVFAKAHQRLKISIRYP